MGFLLARHAFATSSTLNDQSLLRLADSMDVDVTIEHGRPPPLCSAATIALAWSTHLSGPSFDAMPVRRFAGIACLNFRDRARHPAGDYSETAVPGVFTLSRQCL